MLILSLQFHFLKSVLGCFGKSSPPETKTSTPKPLGLIPEPLGLIPKPVKNYHILFEYNSGDVPGCKKCRFITLYYRNLIKYDHLFFDVGKHEIDTKYMDKITTMSIKENYLATFRFNTGYVRGFSDEEITLLYNKAAVFGTITYTYGYGPVQFTIRQFQPGVTIIEEVFNSDFLPLPSRIGRSNYRFYTLPG